MFFDAIAGHTTEDLSDQIDENDSLAIINRKGVRELIELELTQEEQEKLDKSCEIMKQMRKDSIDKIIEK